MFKVVKIIGLVIVLLGLIIILCIVFSKHKNKKEKILLASNKMREEALDKLLVNQEAALKKEEENTFAAVPINVNYDVNALDKSKGKVGGKKNKSKKTMIQIVEKSELSVRKYMFDPKKSIFIGSKNGKNHIVNSSSTVDERQCEIKEVYDKVYVRNMGHPAKVIMSRGKQIAYIEQNYIELKSGDVISMANTTYQIDIIETNEM